MEDAKFLAAVLFFICALIFGAGIQWAVSKIRRYKPPVSILWFVFGMLICLLEITVIPSHTTTSDDHASSEIDVDTSSALGLIGIGIAEASRVSHSVLYHLILPILLYDATQQVSWYHFRKSLKSGLLLAVAGVVFQTVIIGLLMQWAFSSVTTSSSTDTTSSFLIGRNLGETNLAPTLSYSMMTAAAVVSTDPIAVINILEEMEAPAKFSSLFDCESLINDGTSIFMFQFFKSLAGGEHLSFGDMVSKFFTLLCVGPIFGIIIACLVYRWVKHFRNYPIDETILALFIGYLVFYVAEVYLYSSGPLAIVAYGMYFKAYAKAAFDAETLEVHHTFVRGVATAATSLVFIISGIAATRMIWDALTSTANLELPSNMISDKFPRLLADRDDDDEAAVGIAASELWRVPVFYLFLLGARLTMIFLGFPFLRKALGDFTWKEAALMIWGGLRGGICLILALLIEQDDSVNIDDGLKSTAALYIASSAFLVLLINGLTFELLYKKLNPYSPNPFRKIYLLKVLKFIEREYIGEVALLQQHWLFEDSYALVYADRVVPKLTKVRVDRRGKLSMEKPRVDRVLRLLTQEELDKALPLEGRFESPEYQPAEGHQQPVNQQQTRNHPDIDSDDDSFVLHEAKPSASPSHSSEATESTPDDTGHVTAAVLQKLRRPTEKMDIERNLELLEAAEADDDDDGGNNDESEIEDIGLPMRKHTTFKSFPKGTGQKRSRSPTTNADLPGSRSTVNAEPHNINRSIVNAEPRASRPIASIAVTHSPVSEDTNTEQQTRSVRFVAAPDSSSGVVRDQIRLSSPFTSDLAPPIRRIPGYRNDFISRIRSEPFEGALDVANLENATTFRKMILERAGDAMAEKGQTVSRGGEAEPLDGPWEEYFQPQKRSPIGIPRTMSVPVDAAAFPTLLQTSSPGIGTGDPAEALEVVHDQEIDVKAREREGGTMLMVMNTMRQLYTRMYQQNFISGTTFMGFMGIAEVVNDFAMVDLAKKSSAKAWKTIATMEEDFARAITSRPDVLELDEDLDDSSADESDMGQQDDVQQQRKRRKKILFGMIRGRGSSNISEKEYRRALLFDILNRLTGFDVEWRLTKHRLRALAKSRKGWFRRFLKIITCHAQQPSSIGEGFSSRKKESTMQRWVRKFWIFVWNIIGPRQIFPALDDLQLLCAFVDVHEELLLRGDKGLRFVLGPRLLLSYEKQITNAKKMVHELPKFYPDSFPYGMICHAALFLLNLKIQLIEEYFERGLLLEEDKHTIIHHLKEQLVDTTKFHPQYLFS